MKLSAFSRNSQKRYIIEEIIHRQHDVPDIDRDEKRKELSRLGIRALVPVLKNMLTNNEHIKNKDIEVELLSPLAKDIGADSLIEWKDEDERQYIRDSC